MVVFGGNMSICVIGGGIDSNIIIVGSDINVKGNLVLKVDNDINLIVLQNMDEQYGDCLLLLWGVGFMVQFGLQIKFGFMVNVVGSCGNSDGKDVFNVMMQVCVGGQVNIDFGWDMNLIGVIVLGDKVVVDVGCDLNIVSVQDISIFKSWD